MRRLKERTLLYRLEAHRDPDAFGELYDEYAPRIYRFIYFKVRSPEDAEDLTAEVFLKAWNHISEEREIHNFNALLYRIARNAVADYYRQGNQQEILSLEEKIETEENLQLFAEFNSNQLAEQSEKEDLLKALGKLKEEYREVLTMRFIDEMSVAETAEVLDRSGVSVRVLQHRAINALQRILENGNSKTAKPKIHEVQQ